MGQAASFVEGQVGADFVFLDHRQIGFRGRLEGPQQRLDGREARLAGFRVKG